MRGLPDPPTGVNGTLRALIAQLVEHLICNQGVPGSSPGGGTIYFSFSGYLLQVR
jgi:hypothetical protein